MDPCRAQLFFPSFQSVVNLSFLVTRIYVLGVDTTSGIITPLIGRDGTVIFKVLFQFLGGLYYGVLPEKEEGSQNQ